MLQAIRSTRSVYVCLVAGMLLLIAALGVAVAKLSFIDAADVAAVDSIRTHAIGSLTLVAMGVTELASTDAIVVVTAGAALFLAAKRHWRGAVAVSVSVLATQAAVSVGKALMSRPRPEEHASGVDPSGFSFPSAHSASAVALYLMLAVVAGSALRKRASAPVWGAAVVLVGLVGLSRVYLGAHYPTDVLAGWLTGATVVLASWALCARLPSPGRAASA